MRLFLRFLCHVGDDDFALLRYTHAAFFTYFSRSSFIGRQIDIDAFLPILRAFLRYFSDALIFQIRLSACLYYFDGVMHSLACKSAMIRHFYIMHAGCAASARRRIRGYAHCFNSFDDLLISLRDFHLPGFNFRRLSVSSSFLDFRRLIVMSFIFQFILYARQLLDCIARADGSFRLHIHFAPRLFNYCYFDNLYALRLIFAISSLLT